MANASPRAWPLQLSQLRRQYPSAKVFASNFDGELECLSCALFVGFCSARYCFDQFVAVDFFAKAEKEREFLPVVTQEIGGAQPLC